MSANHKIYVKTCAATNKINIWNTHFIGVQHSKTYICNIQFIGVLNSKTMSMTSLRYVSLLRMDDYKTT